MNSVRLGQHVPSAHVPGASSLEITQRGKPLSLISTGFLPRCTYALDDVLWVWAMGLFVAVWSG